MERVLFTKYSNDRNPKFAIKTSILEEEGCRTVVKQASYPEGREHIRNIYSSYKNLEDIFAGTMLSVNKCREEEDRVILEYIEGTTLQEILDTWLREGRWQEFKETLRSFFQLLKSRAKNDFVMTEAFEKVFGNINLDVPYKSFSVTDIDLILSNILVDGNGKWSLIDYEWTFHFPIPVQFLIYRVIHYYEQSNAFRNRVLSSWNLYQEEGISEREKMLFREMEENFQKYMLEEYVPLRHLYPSISPGRIHLGTMLENIKFKERLQIFLSCNGIFTESESVSFPIEQGKIEIKLEIPEGITAIRIDPGEEMGRLEIQQMEWEGAIECGFTSNGISSSEREILFLGKDPQVYIENIPEKNRTLYLRAQKHYNMESYGQQMRKDREKLIQQGEQIKELNLELKKMKREISDMKNTKVWKIYQKLKKGD